MAYPASIDTLKNTFDTANGNANRLKLVATSLRDRSAAGPVNRVEISKFAAFLRQAVNQWDITRGLTGIVAYAQNEFQDPTLDVAAEFLAMRNAASTLADWIYTNIPTGAGGAALEVVRNSDGTDTQLTYSSAALTDFRTNVDTFIATIG